MAKEKNENSTAKKEPKQPRLATRAKNAFVSIFSELSDAGEKIVSAGYLSAETYANAAAIYAEMATTGRSSLPPEARLEAIENEITAIYKQAEKDAKTLQANSDKLEQLFVKRRNLANRIKQAKGEASAASNKS